MTNRLTKSRPLTEHESMNLSLTGLYMRLKAYEETGLEPEEVERYAKAEKDGRLLVLPCKVGDTVWFNTYKNNATECVGIQPHEVKRVNVCFFTDGAEIPQWEFGNTVFLTREDAEKALEVANND